MPRGSQYSPAHRLAFLLLSEGAYAGTESKGAPTNVERTVDWDVVTWLEKNGYVTRDDDNWLELTDEGRAVAHNIYPYPWFVRQLVSDIWDEQWNDMEEL